MLVALDTNVIIAALHSWHEHHQSAISELKRLQAGKASIIIPLPALVESYSVMTRLPAPLRLKPQDAAHLLTASFRGRAKIIGLSDDDGWLLLEKASQYSIAGGRIYDLHILACAVKGGADELLTFNLSDFGAFGIDGIAIRSPGGSS